MTKTKFILLATIASLAVTPALATELTGPYVSLGGGVSFPESSGVDIGSTAPLAGPTSRPSLGFETGPSETPIIPILIGPLDKTLLMWRKVFDAGVFTNPVVPPAVPPSQCRLRTSVMATHTADQIDYCVETIGKIGKELGVI